MRAQSRFLTAGLVAGLMLGASAQAHDCGCRGIELNGRLNTADFDGGVGGVVDYGGYGGGGYAFVGASAHAFAFASAFARAGAFSHGGGGMHGGGMHGGWGGGGHR